MLFNNEYIGQLVYTYVFQTWLVFQRMIMEFFQNFKNNNALFRYIVSSYSLTPDYIPMTDFYIYNHFSLFIWMAFTFQFWSFKENP